MLFISSCDLYCLYFQLFRSLSSLYLLAACVCPSINLRAVQMDDPSTIDLFVTRADVMAELRELEFSSKKMNVPLDQGHKGNPSFDVTSAYFETSSFTGVGVKLLFQTAFSVGRNHAAEKEKKKKERVQSELPLAPRDCCPVL